MRSLEGALHHRVKALPPVEWTALMPFSQSLGKKLNRDDGLPGARAATHQNGDCVVL